MIVNWYDTEVHRYKGCFDHIISYLVVEEVKEHLQVPVPVKTRRSVVVEDDALSTLLTLTSTGTETETVTVTVTVTETQNEKVEVST